MSSAEPCSIPASPEKLIKPPSRSRQFFGLSFIVGTVAGLGAGFAYEFSLGFRQVDVQDFFIGSAALGSAFAAINIAVLALVSVWFDEVYQQVLRRQGGWVAAMRPFRIVATVSILTTLSAVVGLFLLAIHQLWPKALILAITGGLLVWMLLETLVVVTLLFDHGKNRAELVQRLREKRIAEKLSRNGPPT